MFRIIIIMLYLIFSLGVVFHFVGYPFCYSYPKDNSELSATMANDPLFEVMIIILFVFFALRWPLAKLDYKSKLRAWVAWMRYLMVVIGFLGIAAYYFVIASKSSEPVEMIAYHKSYGVGSLLIGWLFVLYEWLKAVKGKNP